MEAKNQEFKTQEQNIQINNNNIKGENDLTKQSELTAETSGTDNGESKKDFKEATNPSTEAVDENGVIPEKDDTPSAEVEPESATPWDFAVTADSTALCEITDIIIGDDGDLLGDPEIVKQAFKEIKTEGMIEDYKFVVNGGKFSKGYIEIKMSSK